MKREGALTFFKDFFFHLGACAIYLWFFVKRALNRLVRAFRICSFKKFILAFANFR